MPTKKGRKLPPSLTISGETYFTDSWSNTPDSIISAITRRLHLQPSHPVFLARQLIESHFRSPIYAHHNTLSPIVTVAQNFDSLGFPANHPGRSRTDTYYINKETLLRTHTSAHQADTFRQNASDGYTISADVYRRDSIDRSHNPIFHQMEGARMWDREKVAGGDVARKIWEEIKLMPKNDIIFVDDPNPTVRPDRNPLQESHSIDEVEAIAAHMKRSLEAVVIDIFSKATQAAAAAAKADQQIAAPPQEPIKIRWVEAYFPFTSPSWELEVLWQNDWLELLGCGVVKQSIPIAAGVPSQLGWAFGVGLERIAMLLFSIPDIRLFWSTDPRFLNQFSTLENIKPFVPFSKHPACYKDVAFWLRSSSSSAVAVAAAGGGGGGGVGGGVVVGDFHENDVMELVREVAGSLVEDVSLVDEFQHAGTGKRSLCYRVNYRSLERTLRNSEVNEMHARLLDLLEERLGVEVRR